MLQQNTSLGGEKMKRKFVAVSSIVLMTTLLAMVSFASACASVPATNHGSLTLIYLDEGTSVTAPSGIVYTYGVVSIFTNYVTIGNSQYTSYAVNHGNSVYNPKTENNDMHLFAVWYFGTGTGVSSNGFIGFIDYKYTGANIMQATNYHIQAVLYGFGSFAGQTLKFDTDNPALWTGCCIIR